LGILLTGMEKKQMSRIGNHIVELEERGHLEYDDSRGHYTETDIKVLDEEIERLEWTVWSSHRDLIRLRKKRMEMEL